MDVEYNKHENPKQQTAGEPDSASSAAQSILERGAEVYEQAEQAVSDGYDKTAQTASETYKKARSYSRENPGKTILIASHDPLVAESPFVDRVVSIRDGFLKEVEERG